jgi:hypothetical protein
MNSENKTENKKVKYAYLVIWAVFSFAILWFLGGGCTNIFFGGNCVSKDAVAGLTNIPIVNLFLPFKVWDSFMYFFAPIAGFILTFILARWFDKEFNGFGSKFYLGIGLIVIMLFGTYITTAWYYSEAAAINSGNGRTVLVRMCLETTANECYIETNRLNQNNIAEAQSKGSSEVVQYINIPFWEKLRGNILYTFGFGGLMAWLFVFAEKKFLKKRHHEE